MKKNFYLFYLIISLLILSCKKEEEEGISPNLSKAVDQYAEIAYANYEDTYEKGVDLQTAINSFLENPSQDKLEIAKSAWIDAREVYGQTEAFRFYSGPIDDEDGPEGLLNAWPLDEAYIDYVEGNQTSGIINNAADYPTIDKGLLSELNEKDGEENISAGYHAIELLLWGQDLSDGPGGGDRSFTDFVEGASTAGNESRRKQYLKAATELLLENLKSLVDAWAPGQSNYRAEFVAKPAESVQKILTGIGKLSKGELAGERMFVAYDLRDKEHEHSCFSDNTHRDIVSDIVGIQNVYLGKYKRNDGTTIDGIGLEDLVKEKSDTLSASIAAQIAKSLSNAEAIQPPFDQEINNSAGRERVWATITSLRTQGDKLVEAGRALGYTITAEVE